MKLRNKQTGEIVETDLEIKSTDGFGWRISARNLAELNDKWEDYEEPKEYWFISDRGEIFHTEDNMSIDEKRKFFGNYFDTREEAEKAVEKFKAWKRLKDKGFRFIDHTDFDDGNITIWGKFNKELDEQDVDLLFGGEE